MKSLLRLVGLVCTINWRVGQRQQCVALFLTRRHPRFARHASPPRINAKTESHLRIRWST